ncbi:MAG: glycosyltransferase family protein [Spirochaetales bacterium]|nr:glycosyltransferase family protein [Spirochaetales bacterium]
MKIVYGVAGEGRGHASRAAALWPFLSKDMDLTVSCPESIGPFMEEKAPGVNLELIPGIHFSLIGHKIDYLGSLQKNLPLIYGFNKITDDMARKMKDLGAQGVISDFEPFTAVAAHKAGLPLLNLNHPAVVRRYLSLLPDAVSAKMVASIMTPPAQKNLICSFYDGDVGPILREEIRTAEVKKGEYILVYVKESSAEETREKLSRVRGVEFRFFPDKQSNFIEALAGCAGVIAPAGHQLLSESLFLKKPVLAIPQKGQYEQRLNARMLKSSGWGREGSLKNLEEDAKAFIADLDRFPLRANPMHRFIIEDHTELTARKIHDFFDGEVAKKSLSRRSSCDYLEYLPRKIRHLTGLTA